MLYDLYLGWIYGDAPSEIDVIAMAERRYVSTVVSLPERWERALLLTLPSCHQESPCWGDLDYF